MPSKKVTIESLARMVASGFNSVESKMATKFQLEGVEKRLAGVESRLNKVEDRLENIEKILMRQQGEKIQNLERRVNRLEEMFAVK